MKPIVEGRLRQDRGKLVVGSEWIEPADGQFSSGLTSELCVDLQRSRHEAHTGFLRVLKAGTGFIEFTSPQSLLT
jgi:hypothetical protein